MCTNCAKINTAEVKKHCIHERDVINRDETVWNKMCRNMTSHDWPHCDWPIKHTSKNNNSFHFNELHFV